MAITLLQTNGGSGGGYVNSFTITPTSSVTAGSLLVLNLTSGNTDSLASISDNQGNTWTLAVASNNPTSGARQSKCYYAPNAAAGATTITVTYTSGQFPDTSYILREYAGLSASPLDVTSYNNDGASYNNSHDGGTTAATTSANELVILGGGASSNGSPGFAVGTGYGNGIEQKGLDAYTYGFMSDKVVTSTGAQSGNFGSTAYVQGQGYIVTFKAASGTPPPTPSNTGQFFAFF